jgi:hypothetical protein
MQKDGKLEKYINVLNQTLCTEKKSKNAWQGFLTGCSAGGIL